MIDLTIKTLDSLNHHFSVEDGTTVGELKKRIRESMGINIDEQRLIFCGRVLTDERTLSECQVHGKVIHLVKRPPPNVRCPPPSQTRSSNRRSEMRQAIRDATRAIHRVANPPLRHQLRHIWSNTPSVQVQDYQQTMTMSPTNGRIEYIWRTIGDVRNALSALITHTGNPPNGASAAPRAEPMDVEAPPTEARNTAEEEQDDDDISEAGDGDNEESRQPRRRFIFEVSPHYTRPRDLATLMEELDELNEEFAPYRRDYINMLREGSSRQMDPEEQAHRQHFVELVTDVIHSFSHAYHAVGDITFHVGQQYPPLTSEQPGTTRQPMPVPVQAHINVVQSPLRQGRPAGGAAPAGTNTPPFRPSYSSSPTADQDAPSTSYMSTQAQASSSDEDSFIASTGTPQFGNAPDPISYHVEIEARVPIALPIDNALLNGIAAVATNLRQETQPQTQPTRETQSESTNPTGQDQARPRVITDLENILRGLTGGNGVEVVMSMEELSPPGNGNGNGSSENVNVVGAPTISFRDGGVYFAPMPVQMTNAEANGGDIMNMISSVFQPMDMSGRTSDATWGSPPPSFVRLDSPGVVRIDSPGATSSPRQGQRQGSSPGPRGRDATRADPLFERPRRQVNVNAATLAAMARARAIVSHLEDTNQQPRFEERTSNTERMRQAQFNHGGAYALDCMVYDRFLPCDSHHARNRMQERRTQYQEINDEQERERNVLPTPMDIDVLMQRNPRFTDRHITTMIELLVGPVCREGGFNAFLVLVARQTFLPNLHLPDVLMPGEFAFVRLQLRGAINAMLQRAHRRGPYDVFNRLVENMLNRHRHYIQDLNEYTPINASYNLRESLRNLLRARMPAIIACAMYEMNSDQLVVRFYNLCTQLFIELCSMLLELCLEGFEGLLTVSDTFMIRMTSGNHTSTREWLRLLCRETAMAVYRNMPSTNVTEFLVRAVPRPQDTPLDDDDDDEEFEVPRRCALSNQQVMPPQVAPVPAPLPGSAAAEYCLYGNRSYQHSIPPFHLSSSSSDSPQQLSLLDHTINSDPLAQETETSSLFSPHTPEGSPPPVQASTTPETPASQLSSETPASPDVPDSPVTPESPGLIDTPDDDMPQLAAGNFTPPPPPPSDNNSAAPPQQLFASTSQRNETPLQNGGPNHNGSSTNRYASQHRYGRTHYSNYRQNGPARDSSPNRNPSGSSSTQSSSDSIKFVPPIMILEHWGKEWVPVFTGDHTAQRERENTEQEPHSDAYLTGMPSRKRRCLQSLRPSSTLDGFMDESIRETTSRPQVIDPEQIRIALRDAVRNMARARASTSEDYSPQRYQNTATFLQGTDTTESSLESNESSTEETNETRNDEASSANETNNANATNNETTSKEENAPTANVPEPERNSEQDL